MEQRTDPPSPSPSGVPGTVADSSEYLYGVFSHIPASRVVERALLGLRHYRDAREIRSMLVKALVKGYPIQVTSAMNLGCANVTGYKSGTWHFETCSHADDFAESCSRFLIEVSFARETSG